MFISVYNVDHEENNQGDIHARNVWEFAPMLSHLVKVAVPAELEDKVVAVNKITDIAERWQYQADVVLTEPRLDPHWNLNGSVLFEEPLVDAWIKGEETLYSQPTVTAWTNGTETVFEGPMIPEYWRLAASPEDEANFSLTQPLIDVWSDGTDTVLEEPADLTGWEQVQITDSDYELVPSIEDATYSETGIEDSAFSETQVVNPDAVHYSEEGFDYRYMYLKEEYHFEVVEDIDATVIKVQEEDDTRIKNIFTACRAKWQEMADDFALENTKMGITAAGKTKEVADAFKDVDYYIRVNSPTEALTAFDLIERGDIYLTDERLNSLRDEFALFLSEL